MIKVSLIVPIYNTEKYLKKCLDSIISQSLKDIEIILINDGSTDNSEKIIKRYKDKRIKYISKKNEGIGKTRNLGIKEAKGEYIAFVDSDDYIQKDFCKKMYEKATNDKCDIVICNYFEEKEGLKTINIYQFADTSIKENPDLIFNINLGPCNKLYKRQFIKDNDIYFVENLKYEDAPFVVKALVKASKIGKIEDSLSYYVIHEKSETTIRDERISDILKITDLIVNILKKENIQESSITNLAVLIVTDYTIQQRYIKDKNIRNDFINQSYKYLNKLDSKWKKCNYLKKFPIFKRIVKSNKTLTKIYCNIYQRKMK